MSRARDYIPSNPAQFRVFLQNILDYVDTNINVDPPKWPGVPIDRFEALLEAFTRFVAAFNNAVRDRTPANILARQEAQAAATHELRGFVNQFLRFAPVTNADRLEMGIPNHDTVRTDHIVVTEVVDFVIHLRNIRELVIDFWQSGSTHKAKPHGYDGAVLVWDVEGIGADAIAGTNRSFDAIAADIAASSNATGSTNPHMPDTFTHHTLASRTPFTLHFEEADCGKTVYVALAWQNERGITGAWSEIKSAVVP